MQGNEMHVKSVMQSSSPQKIKRQGIYIYLFTPERCLHVKQPLNFVNLPHSLTLLLPTTMQAVSQLHRKLHKINCKNHSFTITDILKLQHQFTIVAPVLISSLCLIIEDFQLGSTALDWNHSLTASLIEILMQRLANRKVSLSSSNKFALFHSSSEAQYQFFRAVGQ